MLKAVKIALGILCAAQVVVFCREPISHVFRQLVGHGEATTHPSVVVDLRDVLKRAFRPFTVLAEQLMPAAPIAAELASPNGPRHPNHPTEKSPVLTRRERRHANFITSYLIRNLAPDLLKQPSPAARQPWRQLPLTGCRRCCALASNGVQTSA
ncbi:MAG: hypothetical protein PHT12_00265 [Patescibacteria group bacterium]|nr:hypothetical protein [Patescibacteria group bacterium]